MIPRDRVECSSCHTVWLKRRDTLKTWQGMCKRCASTEVSKRLHVKEMLRKRMIEKFKTWRFPSPKLENRRRGANHPRWLGGITSEIRKIRNSTEFKEWRKAVFKRDRWKCVICKSKSEIQADHIQPFAVFHKLRFDLSNGRTLCKPCHKIYGAKVWRGKVTQAAIIPIER